MSTIKRTAIGVSRAAALLCVLALGFGACSSDDGGGSSSGGTSGGGKAGKSGAGGRGGSGVITGGTGGSTGGVGGGATGGGSGMGTGGGAGAQGGSGGAQGGSGGKAGSAGSGGSSNTDAATGGKSGGSGTADGGQPIGTLCVNDTNCSQSTGKTICCAIKGCVAPCECILEADCPGGTPYLPCNVGSDCNRWGGGKVCCETGSGGSLMRFCTKPSGCNGGRIIP